MAGSTSLLSTYVLRRVGSKATCPNVKDVFRLHKHKNCFGRNSEKVDFYVNSGIHKQLISRQHAELLVYQGEECQPVFVLCDRSMNGTFVNDVKVSKMVRVNECDTITFGHLQGVSIKSGMYAQQAESEFRFVLEKVSVSSSGDNLNISDFPNFSTSPLYCNNATLKSESKKTCEIRADSENNKYLHGTKSYATALDVTERETVDVKRSNLLERNHSNIIVPKSTSSCPLKSKTTVSSKHFQGSATHVFKLDAGDLNSENVGGNCVNQKQRNAIESTVGDGEVLDVAASAIQRAINIMDSDSEPFSIDDDVSNHRHQKDAGGGLDMLICNPLSDKAGASDEVVEESQDASDITIRYPVEKLSSAKSETALAVELVNYRKQSVLPNKPLHVSPRIASLKSLQNLNGKTNPLQKLSLNKLDRRKPDVTSKNQHSAPKKARPGTYRNFSSTSKSEVFVPEKCSSIDCFRPVDNTISWVQCDDCDSWYHVNCMSCDYKVVREPTASFHCGCT